MVTPEPERTYTHDPLLPGTIVPNEDWRFESSGEAKEFYYNYAGTAGFDVRITKTHKTVLEMSCNKQGHWEFYKPGEERVREKMSMRCECKAFVKVKLNQKKGYWFFERIRKAAAAREERENDIPKLLEFFKEMKAQNEYFFYEVQVHSDNVIKNVFWSYASQRAEYRDFGDVVTFDTTYKTNMYSMPLAMFVGSNHQLQNVVFGQALLQDEQANTFEWLFGAFQNCISGSRDPRCILTDQDSAMAAAMKKVFKKTQHRLCRWHMLKKHSTLVHAGVYAGVGAVVLSAYVQARSTSWYWESRPIIG
ncbi:protein FAR1-RELATED SEQUENCE 5-like [Panicum miliaceum]|uniref:Protein FAR1-RELATED SEQUENCE n=1 Tax=Panicum miliaceum TaxID=4540 RepID=A0A3L6T1T9_PANMI|nr:protein FAR1-RELATED SEQUENCE 5-like [Panicum miliaceum]